MTLRILLGVAPSLASMVLAVVFTYAIHALVWCAAVLVALSRKAPSAPSVHHRLWKLALLGPCATAPIAALVPWTLGGTVSPSVLSLTGASAAGGGPHGLAEHPWPSWIALGLVVAAGLGLARFAVAFVGLRRRLRTRTVVRDARVLRLLERICARARWSAVTLTESAAIGSPLVIGTRELCLPHAMLQQLGEAELAAVLGHELGHLERRDGMWFAIAGLLQSVLWMQPLNHWIGGRFRETAELACDDRAVELTGDRLGLARALLCVAESALVARQAALAPAMARARSPSALRSRVQRLTTAAHFPPSALRALGRARAFASVGVCAIASLGASVRVGHLPPAMAAVAAASTERLDALVRRDLELQRQLARADVWSDDHRDDPGLAAWRAAREQELRHVRAEAAWTEQRLERGAVPERARLTTN